MKIRSDQCTAYILDTYRLADRGTYSAGAITFHGRKKMEALRWDDKKFKTQQDADTFVRTHFAGLGIAEADNEGALVSIYPSRSRWGV